MSSPTTPSRENEPVAEVEPATRSDIDQLIALEQACFNTDRLSRRSFLHFIKSGSHELLVLRFDQTVVGYVLVLFRSGTSLARIYSIAVLPGFQGKGFARQLLNAAEQVAMDQLCVFMRLEVRTDNDTAISLYRKAGYQDYTEIENYYEDGCTALQLEKHIRKLHKKAASSGGYYAQTTDFTCGPAALMMAMNELSSEYAPSPTEELQIWREATTIFMTSGHGGCSPHGLALSAYKRGFPCTLYINTTETPFLDSVRSEDKKQILNRVHADYLQQIRQSSICVKTQSLNNRELMEILKEGKPLIALISTWSFNRNKAPHWVHVLGADDNLVYINDPDTQDDPWESTGDYMRVPIRIESFVRMASFGQRRLRALLQLSEPDTGA